MLRIECDGLHENDARHGVREHLGQPYSPFERVPQCGKDGYHLGGFEEYSPEYIVNDFVAVLSERNGESF